MLLYLKSRFDTEVEHYNFLPKKARNLLVSYFLQSAANPILGTFMNAYIWSIDGGFTGIVNFSLGSFLGLPITFFINGLLLKKFYVGFLYAAGSFTLGLSVALVILLTRAGVVNFLIFGFIFGVGYGFYWANRNYLTLTETKSKNRNYFTGINLALETVTSVLVPLCIGWFIYFGKILGIDTYVVNSAVSLMFLLWAGLLVAKNNYPSPMIRKILAFRVSTKWNWVRVYTFGIGITDGAANFLVSLLILSNSWHEGILGTVDSFSAIILGVLFYFYGRKAKVHHQKTTYLFSLIVGILASIFLLIFPTTIFGVTMFASLYYFSIAFIWLTTDPMIMDFNDGEIKKNHIERYSLVFDREVFLNMGRIVPAIAFILIVNFVNPLQILKFTPITTYLIHILIVIFLWRKLNFRSKL